MANQPISETEFARFKKAFSRRKEIVLTDIMECMGITRSRALALCRKAKRAVRPGKPPIPSVFFRTKDSLA